MTCLSQVYWLSPLRVVQGSVLQVKTRRHDIKPNIFLSGVAVFLSQLVHINHEMFIFNFRLSTTKLRSCGCYLIAGGVLETMDNIREHRIMMHAWLRPSLKRFSRARLEMSGKTKTSKAIC